MLMKMMMMTWVNDKSASPSTSSSRSRSATTLKSIFLNSIAQNWSTGFEKRNIDKKNYLWSIFGISLMNFRTSSKLHNFALQVLFFNQRFQITFRKTMISMFHFCRSQRNTDKEEQTYVEEIICENMFDEYIYTLQRWCPLQLVPKEAWKVKASNVWSNHKKCNLACSSQRKGRQPGGAGCGR